MRYLPGSILLTAVASVATAQTTVATDEAAVETAAVVPLTSATYDEWYSGGAWSVRNFFGSDVIGAGGERIGNVEDLIFGPGGELLAVVAEVGGLWDIGDTHVSVPWSEAEMRDGAVALPLNEDNLGDYDVFEGSGLPGSRLGDTLSETTVAGIDDEDLGPRAFRASEIVGDYARLAGGDAPVSYGYVSDLLIADGRIAATVINAGEGFGGGFYAYPYDSEAIGDWTPGSPYWDAPYSAESIAGQERFEYERLE